MNLEIAGQKDMGKKTTQKEDFDKYNLYINSVQSPDADVLFLRDTYKELKGQLPETLCEDFCGTFSISCEWVKLNENFKAVGVDLDPEPIEYGKTHYLSKLNDEQKSRVEIIHENVLSPELPKVDMIAACNFSYFIFKERKLMKEYFTSAYNRLKKDGLFAMDIFGGSQCYEPNEEETEHEDSGFSYFWDQDSFDPVTNHAQFYIHFKRKGEKKREQVFSYDWRMWSIPELRDILDEVGFKNVHVYWEGSDEDGDGNGEFTRVTEGEACEGWVAYIVAEK